MKGLRPSPRTLTKAAVRCLWALNATAVAALGARPPPSYEAHRGYQLDLRPGNASERIDGASGGQRLTQGPESYVLAKSATATAVRPPRVNKTPWSPI